MIFLRLIYDLFVWFCDSALFDSFIFVLLGAEVIVCIAFLIKYLLRKA